MSTQYILYDIPTKAGKQCWSFNLWKTRALLNYKGLDYVSKWVEYPDIKPRFEALLPPNDPGSDFEYSLPIIRFPDGSYVMDSGKIATAIEALHPEPALHIQIPQADKFFDLWYQTVVPIVPDFMPKIAKRLLSDHSLSYFRPSRKAMFGMELEDAEVKLGGAKAYEQAAVGFREITNMYREDPRGPFLLGNDISFCDVVWASTLHGLRIIGEEDVFNRFMNTLGEDRKIHDEILKTAAPWFMRDW